LATAYGNSQSAAHKKGPAYIYRSYMRLPHATGDKAEVALQWLIENESKGKYAGPAGAVTSTINPGAFISRRASQQLLGLA
jgi:hypothetical protein